MTDPDPRTAADDDEDATVVAPEGPEQAEGDPDIAPPQPGSPRDA